MSMDFLAYVLAVMIFYDFSLHLLELILGTGRARKLPYSPYRMLLTKGDFDRKKYTIFWTGYWGIALILILIYIFI